VPTVTLGQERVLLVFDFPSPPRVHQSQSPKPLVSLTGYTRRVAGITWAAAAFSYHDEGFTGPVTYLANPFDMNNDFHKATAKRRRQNEQGNPYTHGLPLMIQTMVYLTDE
jgi:hypothetical protein